MRTAALRRKLICESVPEKALRGERSQARHRHHRRRTCRQVSGVVRGWRELLSLYHKNYVAAGIVFMLHNYATRDRSDRDREKGSWLRLERRRARVGGDGEREKKRLAEEKFFGGWSVRPGNAIRLMNRNNSRAIVLFGSFQLTAAPVAEPSRAGPSRAEPNRRETNAEWRDAQHCFKFLCRANAPRGS